ncbi:MAG: 4-hydroxybenzoate octaprenyltransferase [Alphaproteobacteria bacterium GM7ARS4]|nr:4-hydroxybenzoate octaprenyltransferase [Alphaproteobacteria bacterium GM7ARS4]
MAQRDIDTHSLLFALTPPAFHPYLMLMRLDRLSASFLLLLPTWWGIALSTALSDDIAHQPYSMMERFFAHDAPFYLLFALAAFVMRSAGCVVNDMVDKDIDAHITRTQTRPLACGMLTQRHALATLFCLLVCALMLALALPSTLFLPSLAILPFIVLYPYMKRVTHYPQVMLGFLFNTGLLLAFYATTHATHHAVSLADAFPLPVVLAYAGCVLSTIAFDTVYAHMDRDDDIHVGVKSLAIRWGTRTKRYVAMLYGVAWGALATCLLLIAHTHPHIVIQPSMLLLGVAGLLLAFFLYRLDIKSFPSCHNFFKKNVVVLFIMFIAFFVLPYAPLLSPYH